MGNAPVCLTELLHKPVIKRPNLRSVDNMDYCILLSPLTKGKHLTTEVLVSLVQIASAYKTVFDFGFVQEKCQNLLF
jgi:hypothetical protein